MVASIGFSRRFLSTLIFVGAGLSACLGGCTTAAIKKDSASSPPPPAEAQSSAIQELNAKLSALTTRIEQMETVLSSNQDKLEQTRVSLENLLSNQRPNASHVSRPINSTGGTQALPTVSPMDPDAGFVNDDAVQIYRKAMILYHAGRYPDASLEFNSFLEKYPDHPLAGSAQFYMGSSYFQRKEYKLAIQEYQRVLTSYDRSSHVAHALRDISDAEEALKQTENAARHRHLLNSLFPHSPFSISGESAVAKAQPQAESQAAPAAVKKQIESPSEAERPLTAPLDPVPTHEVSPKSQ